MKFARKFANEALYAHKRNVRTLDRRTYSHACMHQHKKVGTLQYIHTYMCMIEVRKLLFYTLHHTHARVYDESKKVILFRMCIRACMYIINYGSHIWAHSRMYVPVYTYNHDV